MITGDYQEETLVIAHKIDRVQPKTVEALAAGQDRVRHREQRRVERRVADTDGNVSRET